MFGRFFTTALEIRADGTYTPFSADAWSYAGQMTLLGMLMVFSVLAILWGILALFKVIFAGKSPKAPKPEKQKAEKPEAQKSVAAQAPVAAKQDDGELVAVITAAVAAYMAESGEQVPAGGFRVVSFTRVRGGKPWNSK